MALVVSVFKPPELVLKRCVSGFMLDNNVTTITKRCNYYWFKSLKRRYPSKTTNIASIFKASGMWPLYFTVIQQHLKLFKDDGILLLEVNPNWIRCRETVQMEVMLLLP